MSVYKRAGAEFYSFDFYFRGERFHGSTEKANKRDAEAVERQKREEAKEAAKAPRVGGMTLEVACERYFKEVGQFLPRPDQIEWSLGWLLTHLGEKTPIANITNADVARIVAIRRGEFVINVMAATETKHNWRRKPKKPPRLVSNSTVNRSVTEPLRKLLRRAALVWEQPTRPINWREHILREPKERVREASHDEEARLFAALPAHYHDVVWVTLRLGLRLSEVTLLPWSAIDFGNMLIVVTGKGGVVAPVPMTAAIRDRLWALRGRHPERVFCRPSRLRDKTDAEWIPLTVPAVDTAHDRAKTRAGITNLRFHDLRHTAATRLLRKTGNLRAVQKLLRHSNVTTTARYAHVLDEDLRAAMEADESHARETATKSPTESPTERSKIG